MHDDYLTLAKPFIQATQHVLSTMAFVEAIPGTPFIKKGLTAPGDVSAIIGFTGDRNGTMALSFTKKCAIFILKNMLGDDIQDIVQDIKETVGELTNMISGQSRANLSQMGINLQASIPTIILGDNHTIEHMRKCTIITTPFSTPNGEFFVEFSLEQLP